MSEAEVREVAAAIAAHFGPNDSPEDAARSAIEALDRVRDARGDDEAGSVERRECGEVMDDGSGRICRRLCAPGRDYHGGGHWYAAPNIDGDVVRESTARWIVTGSARSPQDEDHEARRLRDENAVLQETVDSLMMERADRALRRFAARSPQGEDRSMALGLPTKRECGVETQDLGEPLGAATRWCRYCSAPLTADHRPWCSIGRGRVRDEHVGEA